MSIQFLVWNLPLIPAQWCTVKVYGRLTKEEYEAEVVPFLSEDKQELDDIKKALKLKYKTLEAALYNQTVNLNVDEETQSIILKIVNIQIMGKI